MALTESDIQQFFNALQGSAELRERARAVILADDFQALPAAILRLSVTTDRLGERMDQLTARMDQLADRMDQLTVRMDQLAERMDQLTARMDQLAERMDQLTVRMEQLAERMDQLATSLKSIDGRVGRLEGWRYEVRYRDNLASHLVRRFRRPKLLVAGNVPALVDALDARALSDDEWVEVIALDVLAVGEDISLPGRPEAYAAIELSRVIDESDVERAHRRGAILRRVLEQPVVACVDGEAILNDAVSRARELQVVNLRG